MSKQVEGENLREVRGGRLVQRRQGVLVHPFKTQKKQRKSDEWQEEADKVINLYNCVAGTTFEFQVAKLFDWHWQHRTDRRTDRQLNLRKFNQ